MRRFALVVLAACGQPAPALTAADVRDALTAAGEAVTESAGELDFRHAAGARAYGVKVSVADGAAHLQTTELFALREARSDAGVVRLLTLLATVNHELWGAAVALDGATGEVSVRAEAQDAAAVAEARERLLRTADALLPRLEAAVGAP